MLSAFNTHEFFLVDSAILSRFAHNQQSKLTWPPHHPTHMRMSLVLKVCNAGRTGGQGRPIQTHCVDVLIAVMATDHHGGGILLVVVYSLFACSSRLLALNDMFLPEFGKRKFSVALSA